MNPVYLFLAASWTGLVLASVIAILVERTPDQIRRFVKQFFTCAGIAVRSSAYDILAAIGAAAFINGVRMKSEPAAWMVAGVIFIAFSVLVTASKKRDKRGRA